MDERLNILGINGSASHPSSNLSILKRIAQIGNTAFNLQILEDLSLLPHFKTALTSENVPQKIIEFRNAIKQADAILFCTPEYVFSIPSGLKNAIEWCVSTTVLSDKPIGIITASASGEKGHEELKLIMRTLQTNFIPDTTLLIQGVKGKIAENGEILEEKTETKLQDFVHSFITFLENCP